MLRHIQGAHYDMKSPYGFGGPVAHADSAVICPAEIWGAFEEQMTAWRVLNGVVSEYCCCNPMLWAHQAPFFDGGSLVTTHQKDVVAIDVPQRVEDFLAAAKESRRHAIARAQRDKLVGRAIWGPYLLSLGRFASLYGDTMRRQDAGRRWSFPLGYFRDYFTMMPGRVALLVISRPESAPAAAAASLLLLGGRVAYYHFAGRADDAPQGSGELLILKAFEMARDSGADWLHLGGGVTAASDDSLLSFKASWSKARFPVHTYRRIFDQPAYAALCQAAGVDVVTEQKFFPAYRAKEAA